MACVVRWEPWEGPTQRKDRMGFRFSQDPTGCRRVDWGPQGPEQQPSETTAAVDQGAMMMGWDQDGGSRGGSRVYAED